MTDSAGKVTAKPRVVHSRENIEAKWIDRTTKWGNPFVIGRATRADFAIWPKELMTLGDRRSVLLGN